MLTDMGEGYFEYHDIRQDSSMWFRIGPTTRELAEQCVRDYERVMAEDEQYVDPPWLWALKQLGGGFDFALTLVAFAIIGFAVWGVH